MTGIYDCFGYGPGYDVPFTERYRLIKDAGFDCVMLWWSDKFGRGEGYQQDADLARNAGLQEYLRLASERANKLEQMLM